MALRPSVGIVTNYGVESTKGTGVSAASKLTASALMFGKNYSNRFYRAPGSLFATAGVRDRTWATGAMNGQLSYEEVHLYLAMMFGAPVSANVTGAAYTHTFTVSSTPAGTFKTLTGKRGDSVAARAVNYLALLSYSERLAGGEEGSIETSGDIIAKAVDTAATLDSVTNTLPEQQISLADVKYYIDTTSGGLGTTEWLEVYESELTFPTNKAPAFAHGSASFSELVETAMEDARLVIRCANTSQARAIEDAMDTDQKPFRYLRREAIGDIIASTTPYKYRANFAIKLESCAEIPDIQSTYGLEFQFRIMHSASMGRACDFAVTNTQATVS